MLQKTEVAPLGCLGTPREQSRSTEWGHLVQTIARCSTHPPATKKVERHMAHGIEDYRAAAKTLPKDRTSAQQALVEDAKRNGMTEVNNLAHAAAETQRWGG